MTQINLDQLALRITQAVESTGEKISFIDHSLGYQVDVSAERWNLQFYVDHFYESTLMKGKQQFCGRLTPGAFAALHVVEEALRNDT